MPSKWLSRVMNDPTYLVVLQRPPVLGQEHQSPGGQEFIHVHEFRQSPVDHNLIQWQNRGLQRHGGSW